MVHHQWNSSLPHPRPHHPLRLQHAWLYSQENHRRLVVPHHLLFNPVILINSILSVEVNLSCILQSPSSSLSLSFHCSSTT